MTTKAAAVTVVQRCKVRPPPSPTLPSRSSLLSPFTVPQNVLSSNWQAHLNTVKADAKGSKNDIHTSKVLYAFKKGKPYLWVHEGDLHNTNTILDERGSLAVISAVPGPLVGLLRSLRKMPARVALAGDVLPLKDDKALAITDKLRESLLLEQKTLSEASYAVSALLKSASINCSLRSERFQEILNQSSSYVVYKFNINSCTYVDGGGDSHDIEWGDVKSPKADLLLPFSEKLIDGINQSQTRRRALVVFCFEYHNVETRDALLLSIDHHGFDVLAKVAESASSKTLNPVYVWKELRFTFNEEASTIEDFCRMLIGLEEEALQRINQYSGLGLKTSGG